MSIRTVLLSCRRCAAQHYTARIWLSWQSSADRGYASRLCTYCCCLETATIAVRYIQLPLKQQFSARGRELWPLTLTYEHECQYEPASQISRSKVISSTVTVWTHTHPTVCFTWTTKVVGNYYHGWPQSPTFFTLYKEQPSLLQLSQKTSIEIL